MSIMVACGGCGVQLRVRDEYLGRPMKCPKCGQMVETDVPPEAEMLDDEPAEGHPTPPYHATDDEPAEVLPVRSRSRPHQEEEDELQSRRHGNYAPCPRCGSTNAERVIWTVWGSFYGPAMLHHVRCLGCGCKYNGRNGRSNMIPAAIFVLVPLVLILAIIGGLLWWMWHRLNP